MIGLKVAAIILGSAVVIAEQDVRSLPSFEVTSVRSNVNRDAFPFGGPRPDGFLMVNGSVTLLIGFAYVPGQSEILGLPDWTKDARFDVVAKANGNVTVPELRLMVQTLLADRFRFRMHYETRERSVYRLTFARPDQALGPRLRRINADCESVGTAVNNGAIKAEDVPTAPNGVRHCRTTSAISYQGGVPVTTLKSGGTPLAFLMGSLKSAAARPIIDETGLTGLYEYTLEYASTDSLTDTGNRDVPSVFTALEEQLGLKLEPAQRPFRVFVVDSIERPTPD
ncbi:MAG: TIGR03435 family protein [Vicinamibacterales bacterium]